MEQKTIIIQWRGPFHNVNDLTGGNGLYFLTGRLKGEKEPDIQYFGITERRFRDRLGTSHYNIGQIRRDLEIWLGKIAYPHKASRDILETAEKILIYFWQPNLNERKWATPPKPTTVISHWFTRDRKPRYGQEDIYRKLYDVLCWDGVLWRFGNLKVRSDDDEEWD